MKATEAKLLEFLKKSPQFVIPIYQRGYSWGEWDPPPALGRHPAQRPQRRGLGPLRRLYRLRRERAVLGVDEVPYVMGLVRQSLEKQMGNGADAG